MYIQEAIDTQTGGRIFRFLNRSIFQLSDIEEWMDRDTDQHMLQLDVLLVNAAAHGFSEWPNCHILKTQEVRGTHLGLVSASVT